MSNGGGGEEIVYMQKAWSQHFLAGGLPFPSSGNEDISGAK